MEAIGQRTRIRLGDRIWSRSPAAIQLRRRVATWVLVPLAIELLTWPAKAGIPAPGLDSSWQAGIEMAFRQHLTFGSQAVFTYGPLGFLTSGGIWFSHLWQVTLLYALLLRFALALAIFASARRMYGSWAAFVIAIVVVSLIGSFAEPVVVLIAFVWALTEPPVRRRALVVSGVAAAIAAIELLNKISVGVTLVVMTAIFVVSLPKDRIRSAAVAGATFVIVLVGLWLVLDQSLGDLPKYIHSAEQISSGYSAAMAVDAGGLSWAYTAALIAFAIGLWGVLHMTVWSQPRQRLGIAVLWLLFCFSAFKEGFVRLEPGHLVIFFTATLGGFLAFRWRPGSRRIGVLATAALAVFLLASEQRSLTGVLNPPHSITEAFDDIRYGLSTSRREALTNAGRALIIHSDRLSPAALRLVRGQTVSIFPNEIALAWAYRLKWQPIPVIQSYSAYTSYLDKLDADFLASSRAPQRLILQNLRVTSIDGRFVPFDEPQTSRAILCHYRLLLKTAQFAILGRVPDRCSVPMLIEALRVDWGQPVPVPRPPTPRSVVFVRIKGVQVSGLEDIRNLLWKPAERHILLDGSVSARLVEGTAGDGLPLSAPAGFDYPFPFNFAIGIRSLAVSKQGGGPTGGRPITYSFYAQSVNGG